MSYEYKHLKRTCPHLSADRRYSIVLVVLRRQAIDVRGVAVSLISSNCETHGNVFSCYCCELVSSLIWDHSCGLVLQYSPLFLFSHGGAALIRTLLTELYQDVMAVTETWIGSDAPTAIRFDLAQPGEFSDVRDARPQARAVMKLHLRAVTLSPHCWLLCFGCIWVVNC